MEKALSIVYISFGAQLQRHKNLTLERRCTE
jgi:hypothetical protein